MTWLLLAMVVTVAVGWAIRRRRYRLRAALAALTPRDVRALWAMFKLRDEAADLVRDAQAGRRVRNRFRRIERERQKVMRRVARGNHAL